MKKSKFMVQMKVADKVIFSNENRKKSVDEWLDAFEKSDLAEEIKIYELSGTKKMPSYELVFSNTRRKIGFDCN